MKLIWKSWHVQVMSILSLNLYFNIDNTMILQNHHHREDGGEGEDKGLDCKTLKCKLRHNSKLRFVIYLEYQIIFEFQNCVINT